MKLKKEEKDRIHITQQQEKETRVQFLKRITPHENHTLWEINLDTLKIKKAEFNMQQAYRLDWNWQKGKNLSAKRSLVVNKNCVYISSLSKKTAFKKYLLGLDGSK